jgi:hypothetical protein
MNEKEIRYALCIMELIFMHIDVGGAIYALSINVNVLFNTNMTS